MYADFLDLPQHSTYVHSLSYDVPRICNLSSSDFDFIMEIDRNNHARPHVYGMRQVDVHDLSNIYVTYIQYCAISILTFLCSLFNIYLVVFSFEI